jgi:hypothetical protein
LESEDHKPVQEADMATLIFVCPAKGEEVFTGIEMDAAIFDDLSRKRPSSDVLTVRHPISWAMCRRA